MKLPSRRTSLALKARHQALCGQCSCSVFVLAALGLLGTALPSDASAQGAAAGALRTGTLPVLRGVVSGQAVVNAPVRGATRSTLTIDQASQRAIIDWKSFNISGDAEVLFRHPGSTASTLNRIYDANPSVIQGKLGSTGPIVDGKATAGGQVILINQNGILFDRGTQINVQSLVASTLNLTNERFLSGVLTAGGLVTPAFAGGYDDTGATLEARPDGSQPGSISLGVSGLASASAPGITANAGGSIMLFAPTIDNKAGIIQAPDGQVMLAAGSKVYLAINDDPNDITLRGFVVEVEAAKDGPDLNLTSLIRNAGNIMADRGNVTLAALAVNQEGRVSAKTAVQSNGSIFLKARARVAPPEDAPAGTVVQQAGSVTFKAGSVTEVAPDAADKNTVPDSQNYQQYRGAIEATGRTIENHGVVRAAGGRIALNASDTTDAQGARVYLGAGSETSVAGVWTDVDPQKNLQTFRVTSNELKNSPDQKNGVLRGSSVTVDLRQGNNLLALDGYRAIVPRTVSEKAAAGGELSIASTGSVIQRNGASIDASGGGYRYAAGNTTTTKLLGDDGKIYDIATAPVQRKYTQLLDRFERTDARWGQTESFVNPLGVVSTFQEAHAEGLAGGLVTISSSAGLVLDGALKGGVTVGSRQLASAPRGAALRIGEFVASQSTFVESQRIGNITFAQQSVNTLGSFFTSTTALTDMQVDAVRLGASQCCHADRRRPGREGLRLGRAERQRAHRHSRRRQHRLRCGCRTDPALTADRHRGRHRPARRQPDDPSDAAADRAGFAGTGHAVRAGHRSRHGRPVDRRRLAQQRRCRRRGDRHGAAHRTPQRGRRGHRLGARWREHRDPDLGPAVPDPPGARCHARRGRWCVDRQQQARHRGQGRQAVDRQRHRGAVVVGLDAGQRQRLCHRQRRRTEPELRARRHRCRRRERGAAVRHDPAGRRDVLGSGFLEDHGDDDRRHRHRG